MHYLSVKKMDHPKKRSISFNHPKRRSISLESLEASQKLKDSCENEHQKNLVKEHLVKERISFFSKLLSSHPPVNHSRSFCDVSRLRRFKSESGMVVKYEWNYFS